MKEEKNIKIKKLINLSVLSFILLTPLIFIGQVNNLKLPNKIDFNLKTKAIISELISDKSVVILRVDTSTIVFPSDALEAGNLDPGWQNVKDGTPSLNPIPNKRYKNIKENNSNLIGTSDATKSITPSGKTEESKPKETKKKDNKTKEKVANKPKQKTSSF